MISKPKARFLAQLNTGSVNLMMLQILAHVCVADNALEGAADSVEAP